MNRRQLLNLSVTGFATAWQAQSRGDQPFLAGLAPSGASGGARPGGGRPSQSPPTGAALDEALLRICDECSQLGLHYLEFNTTNRRLVDTWDSRISQFRDEMAKRGLTILGLAVYSHMHDSSLREELIAQHSRVAKFLKAVGGRYITQLVAPGAQLRNAEDDEYRRVDTKVYAANVNAVAKRLREETGVRIGYHPEQGDIRAGIFEPIIERTDPRYFDFVPDVGHIAACGLDPLPVYKKYRARMIATHFKDYSPDAEYERDGKRVRGRMVPFGQGVVKMPELIRFLRETNFSGQVMGEGGGANQSMRDYFVDTLKLKL